MATEAQLTSRFLKYWRERFPRFLAWKVNDRVARSRPDAEFITDKDTIYVEFKKSGNRPTPQQELVLRQLAALGRRVYLVTFVDQGYLVEQINICRELDILLPLMDKFGLSHLFS